MQVKLSSTEIQNAVREALAEDVGTGDVTSLYGDGRNHRVRLFDRVLIKDNQLAWRVNRLDVLSSQSCIVIAQRAG